MKQGEAGLSKDSTILLEQNMPVNKTQIYSYIGTITDREVARQINMVIKIQMVFAKKYNETIGEKQWLNFQAKL